MGGEGGCMIERGRGGEEQLRNKTYSALTFCEQVTVLNILVVSV